MHLKLIYTAEEWWVFRVKSAHSFDHFDPPGKHKPINMFSVANMYLININQETVVHVHLL